MLSDQIEVRDEEFWYEDGSIVLIAQGVAFRVFRGLLAQHSEVFRDMLSMPQQEETSMLEGCPMVELHDSPEDLRYLLRELSLGGRRFGPAEIKFTALAAVIRLSHKYQFKDLLKDAVTCLKSYFTDSFDVWSKSMEPGSRPIFHLEPADAIAAVNLTRLTREVSMLPTALYSCCQLPTELLLKGIRRADGTTERLDEDDLIRCIDGKANLLIGSRRARDDVSYDPASVRQSCKCSNYAAFSTFIHERILQYGEDTRFSMLSSWESMIKEKGGVFPMCGGCIYRMKEKDVDCRKRIWQELPKYMGVSVPGWS
ncbi:uncharacterized protein LAESUDRAFT_758072 [Laetiporus sulphureus 93-53]|uniref:BTB domain-containing protein n=1 Tax=Laetiporus sulphureus 93-53 TaxID=1314785 RepID=A0A165EXT8_9APHY|nr:uncharacterized protein LAESUDRAFT_758072 [Laetiporus sulphureus 93-53]KZT07943.1 hypothetical protein LAESUDRAFT_758072 [Laetiporus sulphureus 93-53]